MIRNAINRYVAWTFDFDADAFGTLGRMSALLGILTLIVGGGIVSLALLITHGEPPSLFCANGTKLHSQPTTQMVGKVPVDGVEYPCS